MILRSLLSEFWFLVVAGDRVESVSEGLATGLGEGARAALEEATPDLVLSAVMMPRLSGLELCRRLRQDVRWTKVPVLYSLRRGAWTAGWRAYRPGRTPT